MILKGSQRGHGANLATHLMNDRDNEHFELHELRGFAADDLAGAFQEVEAIAKGTRCRQSLFSLILSPPENEHASVEDFEAAIEQVEAKLGLEGQPRAVVFHEKEGRRHAHAVWSRIDGEQKKAINLPFFKTRLNEVARDLYLEHGWDMPKGFLDRNLRNPLNFTLDEWQQAKRTKQDPRLIKAMFRDCWARSDEGDALQAALEERGYFLAKGTRRSVVAMDVGGEVYSLSRWSGVKAKDVKARFSDLDALPSVENRKAEIAQRMDDKLRAYKAEMEAKASRKLEAVEARRDRMVTRHRLDRQQLDEHLTARQEQETAARADRLPRSMGGLWSRMTGKYARIVRQNAHDAWHATQRDTQERDDMIARQLDERQLLQNDLKRVRTDAAREIAELQAEIARYVRGDGPEILSTDAPATREPARDPAVERAPAGPELGL